MAKRKKGGWRGKEMHAPNAIQISMCSKDEIKMIYSYKLLFLFFCKADSSQCARRFSVGILQAQSKNIILTWSPMCQPNFACLTLAIQPF